MLAIPIAVTRLSIAVLLRAGVSLRRILTAGLIAVRTVMRTLALAVKQRTRSAVARRERPATFGLRAVAPGKAIFPRNRRAPVTPRVSRAVIENRTAPTVRARALDVAGFIAPAQSLDEFLGALEFGAVDDAVAICIEPGKERGRRVAMFRAALPFLTALTFLTTLTFLAALAAVAGRVGWAGWLIFLGAERPGRERKRHGGEQSWDRFHSGF